MQDLEAHAVVIRPVRQTVVAEYAIERDLRLRIKEASDAAGVDIPAHSARCGSAT